MVKYKQLTKHKSTSNKTEIPQKKQRYFYKYDTGKW